MASDDPQNILAGEAISTLAGMLLHDGVTEEFRTLASEKADAFAAADIPLLAAFLHAPPPAPPFYDPEVHGLGGWISACQFAVFELIVSFGEDALPFLRETAWGPYDWPQGNAIEMLIRLAAAGVRSDEIIAEIEARFPTIRDEAALYAIKPLLADLGADPDLKRVVDRLMAIEAFSDAYEELTWVDPDPHNIAKPHLHARVVAAGAADVTAFNMHVIAYLDGEDIGSRDFSDAGGKARIYISDTCTIIRPGTGTVEPAPIHELLASTRIAIGHYAFKAFEDDQTCIYPRSVAILE